MRWVATSALLVGCGLGDVPASPPPRPDVILVSLDTTRADRLGSYGHTSARTPTLDTLAASGRRYARAVAPLPLTIPSHASLMTGKYPAHHGVRSNGGGTLDDVEVTLAERLVDAGYATAASVGAYVTTRRWGFGQGFDAYFDDIPESDNFWHAERTADGVVDDALRWLSEVDPTRPRFLWVHLYDPHFPYAPPGSTAGAGVADSVDPFDPARYDAELAFVDAQVARLVAAQAGRPTLWVIVGDHGESLGERPELTHGLFVHDALVRVPWLLSGPGVPAAEVVEQPVSLVDVAPTLLQLLGLPPLSAVDGVVRPALDAAPPVYAESWQLAQRFGVAPHLAVYDGGLSLLDLPRPELYDLAADPGQQHDVSADRPADVARLRAIRQGFGFPPPADEDTLDADATAALEALGYVSASRAVDPSSLTTDPKDIGDLLTRFQAVDRAESLRDWDAAAAAWGPLVDAYPSIVEFRTRYTALLLRRGDLVRADAQLAAALALDPDNVQLWMLEAGRLAEQGAFAAAAKRYREAAVAMPYAPRVRALAVSALRHARQRDEALELGRTWIAETPDDAPLAGIVGVLEAEAGRADVARPLLTLGATVEHPEPEVCWYLGALDILRGDYDDALAHLRREVDAYPGHLRAAQVGARVSARTQHWADQQHFAEVALARAPRDTEMWYLLVLALFNQDRYPEAREAVASGLRVDPQHPDLVLMDANLIAKGGRRDAGLVRFEEAKRLLAARQAVADPRLGAPDLSQATATDPEPWSAGGR